MHAIYVSAFSLSVCLPALARHPFLALNAGKPSDRAFDRGDGFDVYVDAARFLPDNVTIRYVHHALADCSNGVE